MSATGRAPSPFGTMYDPAAGSGTAFLLGGGGGRGEDGCSDPGRRGPPLPTLPSARAPWGHREFHNLEVLVPRVLRVQRLVADALEVHHRGRGGVRLRVARQPSPPLAEARRAGLGHGWPRRGAPARSQVALARPRAAPRGALQGFASSHCEERAHQFILGLYIGPDFLGCPRTLPRS
jgi:hypothetical protein